MIYRGEFRTNLLHLFARTQSPYKMELFAKIVNDFQALNTFAKNSILDAWRGSEYTCYLWHDQLKKKVAAKIRDHLPAGNYMLKINNWNTWTKVWKMFKVNNKDTKTTPLERKIQNAFSQNSLFMDWIWRCTNTWPGLPVFLYEMRLQNPVVVFCENRKRLIVINYFLESTPSYIFDSIQNTSLTIA